MGKVYAGTERPWCNLFVHDTDRNLVAPPMSEQGEISQFDMAHRNVTVSSSLNRSQACGTSIPRAEPHPLAWGHPTSGLFGSHERAHCCDESR